MKSHHVEIRRHDGRSNAEVLIDLIQDTDPGTVFTYQQLSEELGRDTPTNYDRQAVSSVINSALPRVMKETMRTLVNVRMVGYRVAHAREHNMLAVRRKRRADTQVLRGMQTLQHVRLNEMTEDQRKAHQGTLMLVGALWQHHKHLERKQARVEAAIKDMDSRVSDLERRNREATTSQSGDSE